jgi:hypothetical protein
MSIGDLRELMPNLTTLATGALLLAVLVRYTGRSTPDYAIAAALAIFLVTSPWVMPWYAFAAFPFLALRKPGLLAWDVALFSTFILMSDQFPSLSPEMVGSLTHHFYQTAVPLIACGVAVFAILRTPREEEDVLPMFDDLALATA